MASRIMIIERPVIGDSLRTIKLVITLLSQAPIALLICTMASLTSTNKISICSSLSLSTWREKGAKAKLLEVTSLIFVDHLLRDPMVK